MSMAGAVFDDLSPNALVTVMSKRKGGPPPRYLTDRVVGVSYTDSGGTTSSKLSATLRNDDGAVFFDKDLVRKGTVLGFNYGYPGLMIDAGQFVIKGHKGTASTITITANARKRGKLARKKMTRIWPAGMTRSFAVREVLSNHFADDELDIQETGMPINSGIIQRGEHDWQFCTRQAQLSGYELWIDEKGVHFAKPKRDQRPSRLLRYVRSPIGLGEIITFNFDGLSTGIPGRIVLKGKDFVTKKSFAVEVIPENTDDIGELVEPAGPETPEQGDKEDRGDSGNEVVRYTASPSEAEAKQLAQAMLKAMRWGAMKLQLQTVGDPTVRARTIVAVWGIGPAMDGLWWVKQVVHNFGSGGYNQTLDCTREGLAKRLKIRKGTPQTATQIQKDVERDKGGGLHGYASGTAP